MEFRKSSNFYASTGLDLGLDQQYFGRTEGDYVLYTASKKFEGATNLGVGYRTYIIVNQKTGTEFFRWQLDPGTTYVTWATANSNYMNWGNQRFTYEDNTLYATLRLTLQDGSNVNSLLSEDYMPFVDYVNTNYATKYPVQASRLSREYAFFFKADLTTKDITVLGSSDVYEYELQDLFADQGTLFATLQVLKGTQAQNPYDAIFPLPIEVPNLTPISNRYSVFFQLDLTDLSVNDTITLSSTTDTYPYLNNFRRGFDVVSYDNAGNLFMTINMGLNVNTRAEIATRINALNTSVLSASQLVTLKAEQLPVIENYYDLIDEDNTITNFYFNIGITGGFNLETNQFDYFFSNSNTYFYDNDEVYEGQRWQQYFEYEDESYMIENDRMIVQPDNVGIYNWFALPSVYNVSKLYRINLETQAKTLLLDFDNEGVFLTGVYRYTGGFYVTGVYNNAESFTTGLGKAEAFLRAYNASFTKTGEVVLSGSEDDVSQGIVLDQTNKPVWIVSSNSNDGDFATIAADNTTNTNRQYYVRFN